MDKPATSNRKCVVLSGPQAIGKTMYATEIAKALGCTRIIDEWDGKTDHSADHALYITNAELVTLPVGASVVKVENESEILALIQRQAA